MFHLIWWQCHCLNLKKFRDTPPLNSKIMTEHADRACQERNFSYLGSDRVVIVLLGAALQCKFLPFF